MASLTCAQCGAAVKKGDGRFCSHCSAALPEHPRVAADEWATHAERFEQAERDPQHRVAMVAPAPAAAIGMTIVFPAFWLMVWVGITGMMTWALFPTFLVIVPGGFLVFGVTRVGGQLRTAVRKWRSPVVRTLGVVVGERTVQFKDGSRAELPKDGPVAGKTARGDIGLAVMRGGDLIDFHRYRL